MARVKKLTNPLRQQDKRTSWTRFHLPRGQDWPKWSTDHLDAHIGPLADVTGCQKVWLGRKVNDPEQAALIVLWRSTAALKNFQDSPACAELLQGLPENNDAEAYLTSGASLRGLSLGDDAENDGSSSSAPSRFLNFQWTAGYRFEEDLQGRVTLTALAIPYTGVPMRESYSAVDAALGGFLPTGYEDLRVHWPLTPMHFWTAWAWVAGSDLGQQVATAGSSSGGRAAVLCQFRRWNGCSGATPAREEASAESPLARESWARAVAEVMPPVTAWEQERWNIQLAPSASLSRPSAFHCPMAAAA